MLKEETGDTVPTTDTKASSDAEDRKESRDNDEDDDEDDDEETRAHRKGYRRGGQDFCNHIFVVDEDFECAEDVRDAIESLFDVDVLMDNDCEDADDEEEVCLEISDSGNCNEVVDDALDEVEEFCVSDDDGE